jgi:hypothetical protein
MVVIIDAKEAAEATPKILATHRIPHSKSADLRGELETDIAEGTAKTEQEEMEDEDDFEPDEVPATQQNQK